MEEYDVVRVARLLSNERHLDGTENLVRQPRVGDTGTIVHVNAPGQSYMVESCDADGYTVWLADFERSELEPMLNEQIRKAIEHLNQVAIDAAAEFGGLSAEQLNREPSEKEWSIAQCFDHLIVTHSLYFPEFTKLADGTYRQTVWQKVSPLSGFFGRFLVKSLDPKNTKKIKTTAKAQPSSSEIGGDIIERIDENKNQLFESVKAQPAGIDLEKTIVTSPLLGFVTYSLDSTLTFLPMHCRRHFDQARRVRSECRL